METKSADYEHVDESNDDRSTIDESDS